MHDRIVFLKPIISATNTTLFLALLSLLLGLLLAIVLTALCSSRWKIVQKLCAALIMLICGLPEMLVLLFIYFAPTQLLFLCTGRYVSFSAFGCGVFALALIFAAYASQTLLGSLQAVPKGQYEAATALSLSKRSVFYRIILPQAWRYALPGLGNHWLVLLKDTALVSLIEVNDLMRQTQIASVATGQKLTYFCLAAMIYLIITLISQLLLYGLRRWATCFEKTTV